MTPKQVDLVQSTWKKVVPIADEAAALFYGRLFELDPSVIPLFTTPQAEQGKKLMQTISVAVAGLTKLDTIVPTVQELGRRHLDYKVAEQHYDTVGEALLWTLEQGLGEEFTDEVKEAWAETYNTLAMVMKEAASLVEA